MPHSARLASGKHLCAVSAAICTVIATVYALVGASSHVEAREQTLTSAALIADAHENAKVAAVLASERFRSVAGPIVATARTKADEVRRADPFKQLQKLGIDGEELREAALAFEVDTAPVDAIDLTEIDVAAIDAEDRRCLTEAIYYEARNQPVSGQMAVADVVLNRVKSKWYPNSVCEVVYQGSTRQTGCQFSFTCDGSLNAAIEPKAMRESKALATAILGGFHLPLSKSALNYHANYVSPYWAPTLHHTATVGDHVFYTPRHMLRLAMAGQ